MSQMTCAEWRFKGEDADELRKQFWRGGDFICGFELRKMFEPLLYDEEKLEALARKLGCCTRTIQRWISEEYGSKTLSGLPKLATCFGVDVPPIPPWEERRAWGWMSALGFAYFRLNNRREEITRYEFECLWRTAPIVWDLETEPDDTAHEVHKAVRRSIYGPIWNHLCTDAPTRGSAAVMQSIQSKWGVAWAWTRATLHDLRDGQMR